MANEVLWSAGTSRTTGVSSESVNSGANNLGDEIDNSINEDRWASFDLQFTCAVAPTLGQVMELYILYAINGTNYEDGGSSVDPQKVIAGVFGARAVTSAQRVALTNIPLSPFKLKCLIKSELDQNATSVTLNMYTHNEEIQ